MTLRKRKKLKKLSLLGKLILIGILIGIAQKKELDKVSHSQSKENVPLQATSNTLIPVAEDLKAKPQENYSLLSYYEKAEKALLEKNALEALVTYQEIVGKNFSEENSTQKISELRKKVYEEVFRHHWKEAKKFVEEELWEEATKHYSQAKNYLLEGNFKEDDSFRQESSQVATLAHDFYLKKGDSLLPKFSEALSFYNKGLEYQKSSLGQEKKNTCLLNLYFKCEFQIKDSTPEGYSILESTFHNNSTETMNDIQIRFSLPAEIEVLETGGYKRTKNGKRQNFFYLKIEEIKEQSSRSEQCLIKTSLANFTIKAKVKNFTPLISQKLDILERE